MVGDALGAQAPIPHASGEAARRVDDHVDLVERRIEHSPARRGIGGREKRGLAAGKLHPGHGQVDAVEGIPVLPQVLEVVENLECRAQGVGGRIGLRALAVEAQEKAADRVGGAAAIIEELRPVGVAGFHRVLPEGVEEDAGLIRPNALGMQRHGRGDGGVPCEERGLHAIEARDLLLRRDRAGIRDIVGLAHEAVEGEHLGPVGGGEDERRDGKILVARGLGGGRGGRGRGGWDSGLGHDPHPTGSNPSFQPLCAPR
jgi:hypothetical protein